MVSSIERELKTLLSKSEYEQLFDYFNLNKTASITQANYYYDTADELFKQNNAALRLRVFEDGTSEWTVKKRVTELESIELTQFNTLPFDTVPTTLNEEIITSKDIQDFIASSSIHWQDIRQTMALTTKRYQIEVEYGLYALDHTKYTVHEDYELELESDNIDDALVQFSTLLNQYNINYQQAETKLARAHRYQANE